MSYYIDMKYLMLVSAQLRNFKQKTSDSWNSSCPFCGDSKRNRLKARFYIFKAKNFNGLAAHCHNCNISTNFTTFLKHLDPQKYKEYIMETFQTDKSQNILITPDKVANAAVTFPKTAISLFDVELPSISDLPHNHYAKEYISSRRIPMRYWPEIFFAQDYKEFLDRVFPDHGKDLVEKDPRIVLFYTNTKGEITNVSGRSFGADPKLRYITVKVSDERKVYGLHRLDLKSRIYVTEGQFDSLFLDNAVAAGDSALSACADWLFDTFGVKPVVVFDNEPRNRDIVKGIEKATNAGHDVVIWPNSFAGKDINDAVLAGMSLDDIKHNVENHTYNGLTARLVLSKWRKC